MIEKHFLSPAPPASTPPQHTIGFSPHPPPPATTIVTPWGMSPEGISILRNNYSIRGSSASRKKRASTAPANSALFENFGRAVYNTKPTLTTLPPILSDAVAPCESLGSYLTREMRMALRDKDYSLASHIQAAMREMRAQEDEYKGIIRLEAQSFVDEIEPILLDATSSNNNNNDDENDNDVVDADADVNNNAEVESQSKEDVDVPVSMKIVSPKVHSNPSSSATVVSVSPGPTTPSFRSLLEASLSTPKRTASVHTPTRYGSNSQFSAKAVQTNEIKCGHQHQQTDIRIRLPEEIAFSQNDEEAIKSLLDSESLVRELMLYAKVRGTGFQRRMMLQMEQKLDMPLPAPLLTMGMGALAAGSMGCEAFVEIIMDRTKERLFADTWTIYKCCRSQRQRLDLVFHDTSYISPPELIIFHPYGTKGLTISALDRDGALIVGDARASSEFNAQHDRNARSIACCRLFDHNGNVWGVLQVVKVNVGKGPFQENDSAVIEETAVMCSLAIAAMEEKKESEVMQASFGVYHDCLMAIGGNPETKEVIIAATQFIVDRLQAERAVIWLLDTHSREMWAQYGHGGENTIRLPPMCGLPNDCLQSRTVIKIDDAFADVAFSAYRVQNKRLGNTTKTVMVAPMLSNIGMGIGAIQVTNKKNGQIFSEADVGMLTVITNIASSLIAATELFCARRDFGFADGELAPGSYWPGEILQQK